MFIEQAVYGVVLTKSVARLHLVPQEASLRTPTTVIPDGAPCAPIRNPEMADHRTQPRNSGFARVASARNDREISVPSVTAMCGFFAAKAPKSPDMIIPARIRSWRMCKSGLSALAVAAENP